jgi:hypothetical protein
MLAEIGDTGLGYGDAVGDGGADSRTWHHRGSPDPLRRLTSASTSHPRSQPSSSAGRQRTRFSTTPVEAAVAELFEGRAAQFAGPPPQARRGPMPSQPVLVNHGVVGPGRLGTARSGRPRSAGEQPPKLVEHPQVRRQIGQVAVGSVRLAGQHGMQPEPPCTPSRRVARHGVGASGKAVIDDGHGDFSPPTSRWLRYPPPSTSISSPGGHHAERPAHLHWQPANLQRCGGGGRRRANRRHLRALLAQYRSESRYLCQGGCAQRGGRGRVCTGSRPARADHQMRSGIASAQRRLEARQRRIVQPGQVENQAEAMSVGKIG